MKIMAPSPIISWQIGGKKMGTVTDLIFLVPKSLHPRRHWGAVLLQAGAEAAAFAGGRIRVPPQRPEDMRERE